MDFFSFRKVFTFAVACLAVLFFVSTANAQGVSSCLWSPGSSSCETFANTCESTYVSNCASYGPDECTGQKACVTSPDDPFNFGGNATSEADTTGTIELDFAGRAANFYSWSIGVGVFVAFGVIIFAGFLYVTSAGNSTKVSEAKKWIIAGISGLIILLSSYLLLNTINPELTNLESIILTINEKVELVDTKFTIPKTSGGTFIPSPPICYEACLAEPGNTPIECSSLKDKPCPDAVCPLRPVGYFGSGFFDRTVDPPIAISYDRDYRDKHGGYDLHQTIGVPVYAVEDGEIVSAGFGGIDCGTHINLGADSGVTFRYCHLSAVGVKKGDRVVAGQQIGNNGKTGNAKSPHIHFMYLDLPMTSGKANSSVKVNSYVDFYCKGEGYDANAYLGMPSDPGSGPSGSTGQILPNLAQNSFNELTARLGGQYGLAITRVGGSQVESVGSLTTGVAWSTIKVPMSMASLIQDPDANSADIRLAIRNSDNNAALRLWTFLGGGQTAASKVNQVLRDNGDSSTRVQSSTTIQYSAYGQTTWSLGNQVRFMSSISQSEEGRRVLTEMRNVASNQQWGIYKIGSNPAVKGGWGPGTTAGNIDGRYFVRQMGQVTIDGEIYAVAMAAKAPNGTLSSGQQHLNEMAEWLETMIRTQQRGIE